MNIELKPCPFCGKAPKLAITGGDDERCGYNFYAVVCCCVTMHVGSNRDKNGWCNEEKESVSQRAIVKWNTRP